jgi:type IV pilus assembly protein PilQ
MNRSIIAIFAALLLLAGVALADNPLQSQQNLTLELESVPLVDVLYMIAQQNGLNLVVSGEVTGDVSVRLTDVDIATALDAILTSNGYNYFLRGSVIVVKSQAQTASGELQSRMITLRYAAPAMIQKALKARLSEKGQIVVLDSEGESGVATGAVYKANRILITDYPSVLPELVELVLELDKPERVVMIQARIIETKVDDQSKLGILWPSAISGKLAGADDGVSTSSTGGGSTSNTASSAWDPNSGSWSWGKLSTDQLSFVLDFLEKDGNSKLISDPRVSTLENHEAIIQVQTVIPIQTINRFTEGAATSDIVTFQDEEVGISLRVIPRINEDGKITLEVHPQVEDIIGYAGPSDNQKPITSERSVQTTITVNEGETVALGGLLKDDEIINEQRVPLLGHIPFLGKLLFTNRSKEKSTSDLIILITPTILK